MERRLFEKCVRDSFLLIPEKFRQKVKNLAFIVDNDVSDSVRKEQGLQDNETLLGLYTGIPLTERGVDYGVGVAMPDTIHIYQRPIEEEANGDELKIKQIITDTVWHEVAHYFGFEEDSIMEREALGTNKTQPNKE